MIPKVIVFDLGKVLVDFDYSIAAAKIAGKSRIDPNQTRQFIDHSPLLFQYETGLLTTEQFFSEICAFSGFCGTVDEFATSFADIFVPIPEMVEMHAALREKKFPTYIFSNTNPLAVGHIREKFPFFAHFDGYVLSYEHGSMKPDAKLYEVVERTTGSHGAEILYLDDRAENVEAGRQRGWQVILQETPGKSRAAMKQLGLPV